MQHPSVSLFLSLLTGLAVSGPTASAQVPAGWGVFAVHEWSGAAPGAWGGLGLFDPRANDRWVAIQGLPVELTGPGRQVFQGSACVAIRPTDGALFVGELTPPTDAMVDIHQITLDGDRVATIRQFPIGKPIGGPRTGNLGAVETMFWLPDGRLGFSYRGIGAPLAAWEGVAILDPATGAVTEVPIQGLPPDAPLLAGTADEFGQTLYLVGFRDATTSISSVLEVPITGGVVRTLANVAGAALQVECQPDGTLLVGIGTDGNSPGLVTVDPVSGTVTPIVASGLRVLDSATLDRTADRILACGEHNNRFGMQAYDRQGNWLGAVIDLDALPKTGPLGSARSDAISGLAIRHTVEPYGRESAAHFRYAWDVHPGPEPTTGNLAFRVALRAGPEPRAVCFAIADQPGDAPSGFGFRWQIDPTHLWVCLPQPTAQPVVQPLPIPASLALQGLSLFCQALVVDACGVAATRGLRVTVK